MKRSIVALTAAAGLLLATAVPAFAAPNENASCLAQDRQPRGGLNVDAQAGLGGAWGEEISDYKRANQPIGQTFCEPHPQAGT